MMPRATLARLMRLTSVQMVRLSIAIQRRADRLYRRAGRVSPEA